MEELRASLVAVAPGAGSLRSAIASTGTDERLVLFVDQFEELFTGGADDDEQAAFVEDLSTAAMTSPDRFCAIISLRGDFYGRCATFPEFATLLAANHVPVGPMGVDELRRAIELPARRSGLRVESSLVDSLVEEVADEPGGLPLLSTTLVELWRERDGGWLRMEAYERSGGLRGAVARLADGTYEQLSPDEREKARNIFLRLVGPGEGEAVTRRRAQLAEFDVDRDAVAAAVLDRLTRDRLVTRSGSTVEVAHEALLREWPRLRGWIEEDAEGHQLRQHLTQAASQWDGSGRQDSELYRGARLSATLDWTSTHGSDLNELEREFVSESRQASEREAQRIRRTNRRLRGLLVGVAAFLVLAVLAGSFAFVQRGQAKHSATRAQTAAAAARRSATVALSQSLGAEGVSSPRLDTGLLLAAQGAELSDSIRTRSDLLTTLGRQQSAIRVVHMQPNGTLPGEVAVSPDGRTLAVTTSASQLLFFNASTGRQNGAPVNNVGSFLLGSKLFGLWLQ